MKMLLAAWALLLTACSEPTREVTVEVETQKQSIGPVSLTKSVETRVDVDAKRAATIRNELQRGGGPKRE